MTSHGLRPFRSLFCVVRLSVLVWGFVVVSVWCGVVCLCVCVVCLCVSVGVGVGGVVRCGVVWCGVVCVCVVWCGVVCVCVCCVV